MSPNFNYLSTRLYSSKPINFKINKTNNIITSHKNNSNNA